MFHRRDLMTVQEELTKVKGLSVLIYDQTCAAEKRRRRKRGQFPDPPKRAFINTAVCEGCGDCGVKSNCVAIQPVDTELGRKRMVDQSACNKDFSCIEGFCPSFVTVHGGALKKQLGVASGGKGAALLSNLPEPKFPSLDKPYAMIITGIGGTGVVTVSAVLCEAAHLDGKGVGTIDMTGLAQKGGAVACHIRIARNKDDIHAIRVGLGGADAIVGCDLVTTGTNKLLETFRQGETKVTLNTHEQLNGDFTRNTEIRLPSSRIRQAIEDRAGSANFSTIDAHELAVHLFGDAIASNMLMLGFAYQKGHVPVSAAAIEEAIELNGAQIAMNKSAFAFGRLAAHDPKAIQTLLGESEDRRRTLAPRRSTRSSPIAARCWSTIRMPRWPTATSSACAPSPRSKAGWRRAAAVSPMRSPAATPSCSPTRTSTRSPACSPRTRSKRAWPSSSTVTSA